MAAFLINRYRGLAVLVRSHQTTAKYWLEIHFL